MGRPAAQGPADGPEHHRHLRAVEPARAAAAATFDFDGDARPGALPRRSPRPRGCTCCCGRVRTSAGSGRAAGCRRGCSPTPACGSAAPTRCTCDAVEGYLDALMPIVLSSAGDARRPGHRGAGGERVRRLRLGHRVPGAAVRGADAPRASTCHCSPRDQPGRHARRRHLPGVLATANFGSRRPLRWRPLRAQQPDRAADVRRVLERLVRPLGRHPPARSAEDAGGGAGRAARGRRLREHLHVPRRHQLRFTNGANDKGTYRPTVTSYDYDAPLDEAGDPDGEVSAGSGRSSASTRRCRTRRCPSRGRSWLPCRLI